MSPRWIPATSATYNRNCRNRRHQQQHHRPTTNGLDKALSDTPTLGALSRLKTSNEEGNESTSQITGDTARSPHSRSATTAALLGDTPAPDGLGAARNPLRKLRVSGPVPRASGGLRSPQNAAATETLYETENKRNVPNAIASFDIEPDHLNESSTDNEDTHPRTLPIPEQSEDDTKHCEFFSLRHTASGNNGRGTEPTQVGLPGHSETVS